MRLEEIARAKALDCDTIEIWFADEARIGQKNKITRRWAKRGTRRQDGLEFGRAAEHVICHSLNYDSTKPRMG